MQEVDVIVGEEVAIEVKGTNKVHTKHMKGLRALKEEGIVKKFIVVSLDKYEQVSEDGILCLHWREFLKRLWSKELY